MMTYRKLHRFISFLGDHSDAMPCDDPDEEIDQFKMPDPKLWAKRGRANSNPDGEEEDADDDKTEERRRNGMEKRSMLRLRTGLRANATINEPLGFAFREISKR